MKRAFVRACRVLMWCCLSIASACDPNDPCDPGHYADHGACYPQRAAPDASEESDAGSATPSYAGFGKTCSSAADCTPEAPSCGAPTSPVCTAVNCMDKTGLCPPGWTCFDITSFTTDPTVTSACVEF
ncbi:MAG: hypothetical protein RL701_3460 [Pseudomonadota bacterium]